jgi:hypothetical protein
MVEETTDSEMTLYLKKKGPLVCLADVSQNVSAVVSVDYLIRKRALSSVPFTGNK